MAIKDWNGFKKSGDTYIPNDATARAGVTATVDLVKDTTGWTGKNKAVFHGKGIYDLNTGVYTPLDPTNYGAWKKISCKGGEKFVFVCNNAINQVIWYEWNGDTFISATPHSDLTSSYDEYTVGSNTTLVACVARLTGGNITDDSDFGNPMIADAVAYALSPAYEPYHESVEEMLDSKVSIGRLLTSADDLNDITETGIYIFSTSPANAPESVVYGTLIVEAIASGSTGVRQIIIISGTSSASIYTRGYVGSPQTWKPWYKFTGTVVS